MVIILSDRKLREWVRVGRMLWGMSNRYCAKDLSVTNIREVCWSVASRKSYWIKKFFGVKPTAIIYTDGDTIFVEVDGEVISMSDCLFYYSIAKSYICSLL